MFRVQKYRLYPTDEQATALAHTAGVVRFVYNLALEQRRDFFRQFLRTTGRNLSYITQGRELTQLREQVDWIREVSATTLHGALRDLDKAFVAFYRGGGYPRFRKAGTNDSFEIKAAEIKVQKLNQKWGRAFVPKIGWVKYRDTRPLVGELRATRVVRDGDRWFICVGVRDGHEAPATTLPAVGIDRGVTIALALSDGQAFSAPAQLAPMDKAMRRARRALSRRRRGSRRYFKARRRVGAIAARAARVRRDWQQKATTTICREYGTIAIEALRTKNMTAAGPHKRGLNRAILNIGWNSIEMMLTYKLEQRGGTLIKINPAYTSQTCSACGTIDRGSRESQARFACLHCAHEMNADHNAAINILRQGLAGVEGAGCGPAEARTTQPRLTA